MHDGQAQYDRDENRNVLKYAQTEALLIVNLNLSNGYL